MTREETPGQERKPAKWSARGETGAQSAFEYGDAATQGAQKVAAEPAQRLGGEEAHVKTPRERGCEATAEAAPGKDPSAPVGQTGEDVAVATATITGFAIFWSFITILLFSGVFGPTTSMPEEGFLLRLVFLLGFAIMHTLSSSRYADVVSHENVRFVIRIVSFISLVACAGVAITDDVAALPPTALIVVTWLLLGMCSSQVLVFWGVVWAMIDAERDANSFCSTCVAASVLLSAIIGTFMLFAPRLVSIVATCLLFGASLILQAWCSSKLPHEVISTTSSIDRLNLRSLAAIVPLSVAFAMGVVMALAGLRLGVSRAFPLMLVGVATGSVIAIVITHRNKRTPLMSTVERFTFPILVGCLVAFPFSSGALLDALVVAATADFACYLVFHWNTLVAMAYRHHLQPAHHFSQGLISTTFGVLAGWGAVGVPMMLFASPLTGYTPEGWVQGAPPAIIAGTADPSIGLVAPLFAVVFTTVALALVPYASNRIAESLFSRAAREDESAGESEGEGEAADAPLTWEERLGDIGQKRGLTPREREVFALLARGRNTEHIANQLFISTHTVKTHTSRIYRKLEINSQQQLIDQVETWERE